MLNGCRTLTKMFPINADLWVSNIIIALPVRSLNHNALNLNWVFFYVGGMQIRKQIIKSWTLNIEAVNGIVSQNRKRQHKKQKEATLLLLTQNGWSLMESDNASKQTWSGGQKTAKIRDEEGNIEEKSPD